MGKDLSISVLLDIYGDMLTEKQKEVIELYYNEDLSLGEISELSGITRQGVRDSIKRGEAFLQEMEDKLQFAQKFKELAQVLQFFAHAHKFDGLSSNCLHREGRTATGIAVQLGQDNAVNAKCIVKRFGYVNRILTGHGVDD